MTTPNGLITSSFDGTLTPAQVSALLNSLIEGAPFAASLTRAETSTGRMAFPTVAPTGWAWLEELQQVPTVLLNDESLIVAVAGCKGIVPVSQEMFADASVNITRWVSGTLADSLSRDLDLGLLNGTGRPQPNGIVAQADPVTGATLTDAAGAAIAAIGEAGGTCNTIALSPTAYAAELTATDSTGRLLHPDGLDDFLGLSIVQVPALVDPLAYDSGRIFLVLGQDSAVTVHDDFQHDALALLVKCRANVAAPVKDKSIRLLAIGTPDEVQARRDEAQAKRDEAQAKRDEAQAKRAKAQAKRAA